MKRAVVSALALALGFGLSTEAHAFELGTPEESHPYRSPQNFAFELRGSPYYPKIDDEPGLAGRPFEGSFGTTPRVALGVEFDWQVYRIPHVGTLGLGAAIGLTSFGADVTTVSGKPSGDNTGFTIYPMWTVAVLRADAIWREAGIPFVPYGKVGLGGAYWKATNTGETMGKGLSLGTQLGAGVAFALDSLDPSTSKNADSLIGINGTYLFAEYYWLNLNGLLGSDALRAGTNTWAVGLAWEF